MNKTVKLMFAAACLAAGMAQGEPAKFGSVVGYDRIGRDRYGKVDDWSREGKSIGVNDLA